MRILSFLCLAFIISPFCLFAQLPQPCAEGFTPSVTCENACIFCNFDGYVGSTIGFPSLKPPKFCGTATVENVQWLGFIAGADFATFTITPSNCFNGNGVQVALYSDCNGDPLACNMGEEKGGKLPVSISTKMNPGQTYYLLIDGYAGDQCDFSIDVSPREAVFEPALGTVGSISGPSAVCPGSTATFSVAPVTGAGAYIWDGPPGATIDSMPLPAVVTGEAGQKVRITFGSEIGPICVQAANACKRNAPCTASLQVLFTDPGNRPQIKGDTIAHLSCTDTPLALDLEVRPKANYLYAWDCDSTGNILSGKNERQPRIDKQGVYTLLVTNPEDGCTASQNIRVGPPDVPTGIDLSVKHVTCYGRGDAAIRLMGVTGGNDPYLFALDFIAWNERRNYDKLKPGMHHLSVQTIDGCEWDTLVAIQEPPELLVRLGDDAAMQLGDVMTLWDTSYVNYPARIQRYRIEPDTLARMVCDTCVYRPTHSFRYAITVVDSNGCQAHDEKIVTISKRRRVFIPNVFMPEADNQNARLVVSGGDDVALVRSFRVFNRWGVQLYESRNFQPGDPAAAWDGNWGGSRKAEAAVYVYKADVEFIDGETQQIEGSVTLIR